MVKLIRRQLGFLLAIAMVAMIGSPQIIAAFGNSRTISFYNIHTKETATILYKKDGKFIPSAMKKVNWIMRDYRRNEPTKMDPKLIDILWEIHTELGSKKPIHLVSGYRSLKTNNMLRKTRGGQAKKSQHILGKAADVHFPDVAVKKLRYSALVRERGGVGYYPTSALPFVHVDTGRVRHWPRIGRYELALLFPNGSSKHRPRGGRLTKRDVRIAQKKHKSMARRIASFHSFRKSAGQRRTLIAAVQPAKPTTARRSRRVAPRRVAALTPPPPVLAAPVLAAPVLAAPVLISAPRRVKRPARRIATLPRGRDARQRIARNRVARGPAIRELPAGTRPSRIERNELSRLAALASTQPLPRLVQPPRIAKPRGRVQLASLTGSGILAGLGDTGDSLPAGRTPLDPPLADEGWSNGWVQAPAFDDEHPDELSYRPFPIAPLLTATASADDPALSRMTHPDAVRTLELLDGIDAIPPMKFRPGLQVAALRYAQQFAGPAVSLNGLFDGDAIGAAVGPDVIAAKGLNRRRVRTQGG